MEEKLKIGLEIHGYIDTEEKLFCSCKAIHGAKDSKPNEHICPICTGQPGSKPELPNKKAVDKAIEISLILNCKINSKLPWQRKHYSWPDLPKGYQNTLSGPHAFPIGIKGKFEGIGITECHLEEDPAAWNPKTGEIDYNRSGSPLIEIVTDPDFTSKEQVAEWLKTLKATLGYIKAIDKKAGLKADVNVSLPNQDGKRIEIKNVNSIKNIVRAIQVESDRQKKEGAAKEQETRRFDEKTETTSKMRSKENAEDYRFISDPDLPIINIQKTRIDNLKKQLPETPKEKLSKLIKKHKIQKGDAEILTKNLDLVELFESVVKKINPKTALRWTIVELPAVLNYNKLTLADEGLEILEEHFVKLLNFLDKGKLTEHKAREILRKFIPKSFDPEKEVKKSGKISDSSEIEKVCDKVIKENGKAVEDFKSGNASSLNFLIGQVMKHSKGRADVKKVKEILEKRIK